MLAGDRGEHRLHLLGGQVGQQGHRRRIRRAALPGDEFFAALKQAWQDGTANPALIADCERRITSREAGPRELHRVLFAASDCHGWAGVRALALAAVGQPSYSARHWWRH